MNICNALLLQRSKILLVSMFLDTIIDISNLVSLFDRSLKRKSCSFPALRQRNIDRHILKELADVHFHVLGDVCSLT